MTNPQHNGSRPPAVFDAVLVWLTWREYRAIKARDLFGAASAAAAERRLKECAEALEDFADQVYQARERP